MFERIKNLLLLKHLNTYQKISLKHQQDGNEPIIITVDGFLNKFTNCNPDWEIGIKRKYSRNIWLHMRWDSGITSELVYLNIIGLFSFGISFLDGNSKSDKKSQRRFAEIMSKFSFTAAKSRSERAGKDLFHFLANNKNKKYILIGHSLGANLIKHCLLELSKQGCNNIQEVHLLGGATENHIEDWFEASNCVEKEIKNYFSSNDLVLKNFYSYATNDKFPIGRTKINCSKVKNIDVTKLVSGHQNYVKNYHFFPN